MPKISFTPALQRFFPELREVQLKVHSVKDALEHLEELHPGIKHYLVEETGQLRKHINIFIGERLATDRSSLSDVLEDSDEVLIFQALSGG